MFERRSAIRLGALVLLVGLVGPAQAATIASSSIRGKLGQFFQCVVTNVSSKDREVTIEVITAGGALLGDDGPVTVLAGRGRSIAPDAEGAVVDAWCRITVSGGKSSVRGTLNLIDSDSTTLLESLALQ
jgi:hypothetical protein